MSADVVLQTSGLTKDYGRRRVVDGLDLTVHAGEVFGFLGPNGAGKSTTIRMLLGLIRPVAGTATLLGHDLRRARLAALRQVGAQVETPAFYGYLSGWRNLELFASLSGPVDRAALGRALERVRLTGREHDKVRTYSQGMRMRLSLALALLPQPRLLILDEPTNGLDPHGMKEVRELIAELARTEQMTIFLSSHLLGEVQQVCQRVAVIDRGRLVAAGPVAELLRSEAQTRVTITVDQPARAAALAVEQGAVVVRTGDGELVVECAATAVAGLNAALVGAGLAVSALTPHTPTLEDYFLRVTGGAP